ncbi:MAG: rRNA cytosine-C5-methyltransferase [Candidatus Cryptobacteroides sp.]
MNLNPVFIQFLEDAVGAPFAGTVAEALSLPASVSVRANPFKMQAAELAGHFGNVAGQVPWCPDGLFLVDRPQFTLDPLLHAGAYYVQDSSAMFPGHVFRQALREILDRRAGTEVIRVLDLCAAPGGKTTDLAASLRAVCGNRFILVANEIMKQRAAVLSDNAAIWGDPCVLVTSADPSAFASLQGFFDIILADVPCSGEGMFRKDQEAVAQWSADNVMMCQARQRRIIADVWPSLAGDGMLVYSTCTFNRHENDENVAWIAGNLGADMEEADASYEGLLRTGHGVALAPGLVRGEGQYCALLRKKPDCESVIRGARKSVGKNDPRSWKRAGREISSRLSDMFCYPMEFLEKDGMIVAVPEVSVQYLPALECLHPLMRGVAAGQVKGRDFVPDADLALCIGLKKGAFPEADLDLRKALAFLHRDPLVLDNAEKGYVTVTYEGLPLGFVKNLGNRCNSLHPQHRRIRMDI